MISNLLDRLAQTLFLPVDQIVAALCLLLSFPFAFLFHSACRQRELNSRPLLWALAVLPTYFFMYICFYVARNTPERLSEFAWDIVSVHLPIICVYFGLKCSAFWRRNPTLIFALLLAQLSYHHISRQVRFYNQYTVNITGPLMMLIIKLSSFAYDVHDGKIVMNEVGFGRFSAWNLLFAGFFTGPVVSYTDFTDFYAKGKAIAIAKDKAFSGRKRRASFVLICAAILLIFGLALQPHFPTANLLQAVTSAQKSFLEKTIFMHLSLLSWRIKYYVAWSLAEGALVVIGFGSHKQENGKIKWNRYQNINFFAIESSCDFRTIISEWNVTTNRWLNQYVYQRLGRTFKANLVTYLVSAFWHGFYPGYYVTFVSGALYTAFTRLIYKYFTWPLPQKYRRLILYVPNYLLVDYFAAPFALQTFTDAFKFCRAWAFYGHIVLAIGFLVLNLLTSKPTRKNSPKLTKVQ